MAAWTWDAFRDNRRVIEVAGLLMLLGATICLLALVTYDAADATWFNSEPGSRPAENWFGRVGATLAESLLQLFGTAALLVPLLALPFGWSWLRGDTATTSWPRVVGILGVGVMLCTLLDLAYGAIAWGGERFLAGGYLGNRLAGLLQALLATPGAVLVTLVALVSLVILLTGVSAVRSAELAAGWARRGWHALSGRMREIWLARRPLPRPPVSPSTPIAAPAVEPGEVNAASRPTPPSAEELLSRSLGTPARPAAVAAPPPRPRQVELPIEPPSRGYSLPPIELLNEATPQPGESEDQLVERARVITEKLQEFNVNGSVVAIHPGPVVTTFEFKPEAGVKYSKVTGMHDDLSLALRAESVRIDRMPGRATIGIEIPNSRQATIFPRDLLASVAFRSSKSKLTMALGTDISGDVFTAELDRMPHLLIAGATGAGKSVGLNGMIISILFKARPDEVRFIMIDTKMIELGIYASIPHLLIPVVTEPKKASTALKWAVREMEQRYRKLASTGVRNLAQFNELLEKEERTMPDPRTGEDIPLEPLPYIVIVIDELADLMMIASADVEESIMRLAQMARAVGIHLIIATQRPSVDVITGTIKANFPSRIAFRVSQRVDSRTIIDQQGAEHLLGRGDMLFLSNGSARLQRCHGGYITEAEIHRVTSFMNKMADPVYDESVLKDDEQGVDGEVNPAERDEMYLAAVKTILNEGKCSITLIQRRLQLGYARAARIVDMMEREGIVSQGEGSKPREILVPTDYLDSAEQPSA